MIGAALILVLFLLAGGCLPGRQLHPQVAIWATGESRKVLPGDPPQLRNRHWDGETGTVTVRAGRNEWTAFQFILNSPRDLADVRVEISPLSAGGETELRPGREIRLFRELYVRVRIPTDRAGSTGPGEYPDPLVPFFDPYSDGEIREVGLPLRLEAGRNLPIWIEIRVPAETPPGTYRGSLAVFAGGKPLKQAALEVEVWNFTLPEQPSLAVFFDLYGWRWSRGEGLPWKLGEKTWEVLSRYEIMAHEHLFSLGHWGLVPEGAETATAGVDWTLYDRYLGRVIDGSLFTDGAPPACWELPFPEMWDPGDEILAAYCREVVRHWDEKGWDLGRAFVYVWDEMGPENPRVKSYGKILREASGNRINYFYTCPPSPSLYGVVDWWAPRASEYDPESVRQRQADGEKGFFYHAGEPAVGLMCLDADGLAWRTWAWMAWIYGSDGFFGWAGNFWSEEPYLNPLGFGTDNGNLYVFYPGRQLPSVGFPAIAGPVPSFRTKALRRGLQDYEYFRLAAAAGLEIEPAVRSVVRRGLGITGAYGIDPGAWSRDPEDWYRVRDAIGEMLHRKNSDPGA